MKHREPDPWALAPGTVVSVPAGLFRHFGIVTDRLGGDGCPMVISNSMRGGGVHEEPWGVFTQGGTFRAEGLSSALPVWQVLARARSRIGSRWTVLRNCEHFVREALGIEPTSPQLRAAVTVAVLLLAVGGVGGLFKGGSSPL